MRLIDADALIAEYDRVHIGPAGGARKLMVDAPTVDAVEVVHGEWIVKEYTFTHCKRVYCSRCDYKEDKGPLWDISWGMYNYCPHCGAKMDGVRTVSE